jgi:thymidylate kinase
MLPKKSEGNKIIVAFEGQDYVGKSTIISGVSEYFNTTKFSDYCKVFRRPQKDGLSQVLSDYMNDRSVSSVSRQKIAMAEDCIFNHKIQNHYNELKILDRFNVISGMVYGPQVFVDRWRQHFTEMDKVAIPKIIFHIVSETNNILERMKLRGISNIYDSDSTNNVEKFRNKYLEVLSLSEFKNSVKIFTIRNDEHIDTAVSKCVDIIKQH